MIDAQETGSKPAPGELAVVQAFLNTVDLESGEEQIRDPAALAAWLVRHGLLEEGATLGDGDLRLALQVREALRGLASANHEGVPDPDAARTLDRLASVARLRLRFDAAGRPALEPELPGIDGAVARLLAIVFEANLRGTWSRFKACRRESCRWAFYDRSKNRSGSWCTMAVCGNREKAKAYRRRRTGS